MRVNANQLGVGNPVLARISMFYAATGAPIPVTTPQPTIAFVQRGLAFDVLNSQSIPSNTPTAGSIGALRFREGFAAAFKRRTSSTSTSDPLAPPAVQNVPGAIYNSESSFIVPGGPLQGAGLTDFGMRLRFRSFAVGPAAPHQQHRGHDPWRHPRAL